VAAVWNRAAEGEPDAMQAGRFRVDVTPAPEIVSRDVASYVSTGRKCRDVACNVSADERKGATP